MPVGQAAKEGSVEEPLKLKMRHWPEVPGPAALKAVLPSPSSPPWAGNVPAPDPPCAVPSGEARWVRPPEAKPPCLQNRGQLQSALCRSGGRGQLGRTDRSSDCEIGLGAVGRAGSGRVHVLASRTRAEGGSSNCRRRGPDWLLLKRGNWAIVAVPERSAKPGSAQVGALLPMAVTKLLVLQVPPNDSRTGCDEPGAHVCDGRDGGGGSDDRGYRD